jgi:ABC-type sugar transport system permease subunit
MYFIPRTPQGCVAAAVVVLGVVLLAVLPAALAAEEPAPPTDLRVTEIGEFSVNITFRPSPSTDIGAYRIYASSVNGSAVNQLVAAPGFSQPLYDTIHTTAPGNTSKLQPALGAQWFWFQNATQTEWTLGYGSVFDEIVPSDVTALAYRLTGLKANETVWIAVTAVDLAGVENPSVSPVSAVPLAQAIPEKPHNEGIYLSWGLIIAAVIVAVALVSRWEGRKNRAAYLYILPPLVGLVALTFYPVIFGFFISFTNRVGQQSPTFSLIWFDNYVRVFEQPDLAMVATTTLVWTLVNVFFHVSIGLFLAVLLNRKLRGRVIYRALLLLPWAVPSYITTLAWRGMFETHQGLINSMIGPFGWQLMGCGSSPCQWLTATNSPLPLIAVIMTNIWLGFPFMMMVFSGALQGIPPELYEAADVDGLTPWQKFRHITFPLLKPSIVPASLLGFIWTFNMFNVIYLMTAGRPPVPGMRAGATDILITFVYRVGFQPPFEQGFAAAYSVVIFFMLLGFGLFYTKYTGALEAFAGGTVARRAAHPSRPSSLRARLSPLRDAWDRRVASPVRMALGPDQPEHIRMPWALVGAIGALGIFEMTYGVTVVRSMAFWYIVDVVHGFWFFVVGLGLLFGAFGMALLLRAGRRIAGWSLLLEIIGAFFAFLSTPVSLLSLRLPLALVFLGLLARPVAEYTGGPGAWTRFMDGLGALRSGSQGPKALRQKRRWWTNLPIHAFLIFFAFLTILPILVVVGTAFGEFPAMALANTPFLRDILLPGQPLPGWTLEHFRYILFDTQFSLWLRNSVLVSVGTTAVGLLLSTTGAYGFSRFLFRGKRWSMLSFIIVQMFPGAIILIPYYVLLFQLGLINQLLGLVIMYSVTALPFVLWFLKGFFDTIPVDLEEAAMVDGTTRLGALWRVIVPLATPAIAVAALFSFLSAWNEWLLAFTFMTSSANYTLPVGVSSFVNPPQVFWNAFAAISILISVPVAALFIIFQKYLVSGLTRGAVKG